MTAITDTAPPSIPIQGEAERLLYGPQIYLTLAQVGELFGLPISAVRTAASKGQLFGLPISQPGGPRGTRRVLTAAVRAHYEAQLREAGLLPAEPAAS